MLLIRFALRRIIRHWRLYFFILLGISLISGFLAGLPLYSQTIAFNSLQKSIEDGHPIERNFEVRALISTLTSGMWGYIEEELGDLIENRIEIRTTLLGAYIYEPVISTHQYIKIRPDYINIFSLNKLTVYSTLVEGKWPEFKPPHTQEEILRAMTKPPDIEAVIGLNASKESGIKIGDIVVDDSGRHFPIVGIVEPKDPTDDAWWGNMTIFSVYKKPGLNEDTNFLSVIVHQNNLREYYPAHDASWRLLVNHEIFTPDNIATIEHRIVNFKSRIEAYRASLQTNLPNLLEKYREDINTTRMVVLLLSMQSFIFLLYGLFLIESLIFERAQTEFATMVGRGSSSMQLIVMIGIEGLIVASVAGVLIGPLLASSLLFIWSKFSGIYFNSFWDREGYILSILGAGIGWLTLLFGTAAISRRNIVSWQKIQSRSNGVPFWQKYYIDILLIGFSGLTYWQLSHTGSFIQQRFKDTDFADPFLLISPTLFLFSIALIFLRIYPYLLKLISWIFHSIRGIILPLSLKKLSRDPVRPSQMILLISIAACVTLFSIAYNYSFEVNQSDISHYLSGADIRISKNDLSLASIANYPAVLEITEVFRHVSQLRSGNTVTILGIDPSTFPKVIKYPPGMTNITIQEIANVLQREHITTNDEKNGSLSNANPDVQSNYPQSSISSIPAIFSYDIIPKNVGIGDQQEYTILTSSIIFNIRGVIQNFPTMGGAFIVTDLTRLASLMNLERSEYYANYELWLSIDPEMYQDFISTPFIQEELISDAQQELRLISENAYAEGAVGAFKLNTFILSIISTLIFSLLLYSMARNRNYEFGILQAEGLSSLQLVFLLLIEGSLIVIVGIGIGTLIGIGLTIVMRPYLNIALMSSFPDMVVYELYFPWNQIAVRYGILILSYLVALGFATWQLMRIGIHQVIRLGEE